MASGDMEPPSKAPRLTDNDSDAEESSYNFSTPLHFSDVVLIVEGRKFHVHKSILSMWSPVFEKMFSSGFRERKAKEISLPGKDADEFEVLLKMIYSFKTNQDVTDENYEFLLKLANEYQIERVKDICAKHMSSLLDFHNSIEFCQIADQYALHDVIANSISKASRMNMESIESSPCYSDISDGLKVDILTQRVKHLEELLHEYSATCSSLVDEAYAAIRKKVPNSDTECVGHEQHDFEKNFRQCKIKFDLNCSCCIRRLDIQWPEKDALTKYLKEPLKKLISYQNKYRDLNNFISKKSADYAKYMRIVARYKEYMTYM